MVRSQSPCIQWGCIFVFTFLGPRWGQAQDAPRENSSTAADQSAERHDQDEDLTELSLDELLEVEMVSATRRVQKISAVPYAVSVITAADIRQSGARNIADALRLVPGVDVSELSHGAVAISPRGMHGFLSNMVLVLVDGRQIFDPAAAGTFWGAWPFQLEDIERIEVIRGPGGVTWGANAVNGVINIVTKDPADQLGFTLNTQVASRGTFKQHAGYAFQDGDLRMRFSGEYEGSSGFEEGGSFLFRLDDEYDTGRFGLHAIYDAGEDDTFTISGGYAFAGNGHPPGIAAGFDPIQAGHQSSFLLLKWDHRLEDDNRFSLTAYANDFFTHPGLRSIDYRYQQIALQFSHTFVPSERHTLTWGVDSRVDLTDGSGAEVSFLAKDHVSTGIIGLYVQDEWRLAPKWTLHLGGRIDYDSYGGFEPSVRGALSYRLSDNSSLYGAFSRAYHMPPGARRFCSFPIIDGLGFVESKRSMDTAQLLAYEIGYRGRLFNRLNASVNLFWHQYEDINTFTPMLGPPGLLLLQVDGNAGGSLYGAELDAQYAASDKLTLLGNYTFQQSEWYYSTGYTTATDFMEPPQHKFMVGTRYDITDDLYVAGNLYYVDAVRAPNPAIPVLPKRIDSYYRLDLRTEYEFWNDQASVAVGVKNLLDSNHFEGATVFANDAEVPRMFYAEFRVVF
ncbi:MAG: TonB-dependent receptor plug domain-containing protein [Planctomycetota bacterium]